MSEVRVTATEFECRAISGGGLVIEGYGAVFGKRSQDLGGFVEEVGRSAFNKTIKESDVRALFNHDPNYVLGRMKAGTLELSVDSAGLPYRISLPNTTFARDLYESMSRGDINQSSFSFEVIRDSWTETEDRNLLRTLEEVRLFDVGPVTFPAYEDAASGVVRSLARHLGVAEDVVRNAPDFRSLFASDDEAAADSVESETPAETVAVPQGFKESARRARPDWVDGVERTLGRRI